MPEMQLRLQVGLHFTFLHQSLPSWTGFLIHPQGSIPLCQDTIPLNNNESGQFYHAASLNSNPETEDIGSRDGGGGQKKKDHPGARSKQGWHGRSSPVAASTEGGLCVCMSGWGL